MIFSGLFLLLNVLLATCRFEGGRDTFNCFVWSKGEAILFYNDYFLQTIFCILFLTYSNLSDIDMLLFLVLELFSD